MKILKDMKVNINRNFFKNKKKFLNNNILKKFKVTKNLQ